MLNLQYVNITYYVILTYPFLLCGKHGSKHECYYSITHNVNYVLKMYQRNITHNIMHVRITLVTSTQKNTNSKSNKYTNTSSMYYTYAGKQQNKILIARTPRFTTTLPVDQVFHMFCLRMCKHFY